MKRESYEKEFNTFQQNNIEAIDKYESTNICLDNSFDAIYKIINKSNILNVQQFLCDALVYANENMVDIVDACKSINETTSSISNTTTFYFNQVQNVYKKNGNIDISNVNHSETDPVKMVENNLKTVISIAKRYLNRGLSLDDLISAGNLGLCEAVNKYKDSKWKLRNAILMDMAGLNYVKPKKSKGDSFKDWDLFNQANMQPNGEYDHKLLKFRDFSLKELKALVFKHVSYGTLKDEIQEKLNNCFNGDDNIISGVDAVKFICANIPPAKFNSVACMWIKAYILQEINKTPNVLGVSPAMTGTVTRLDAPIKDNTNNSFETIVITETDDSPTFESAEDKKEFNMLFDKLCYGIPSRHVSIIKKYFGIDMPAPMLPKDIATHECISTARVSQMYKSAIDTMKDNAKRFGLETAFLSLFNK